MVRTVWTGFRLASILALSTFCAPACSRFTRREVGGTDSHFLNNFGICTYGISGIYTPPEGSNAHGLNEKLSVKSLCEGHRFLYLLGKRLCNG